MSIQAVGAVIELRGIPPVTKLVLTLLANAFNGHTGQCNPDQARLSEECGISERSVRDHLNWLEANGYIARRVTEMGRGEGKRTDFDLLFLHRQNLPEQRNAPEAERQCSGSSAQLLRKQGSGAYKDKPEENRKEPEYLSDHVRQIWDLAPSTSRKRSSQKLVKAALEKAVKETEAEKILAAWKAYLASPDAQKNDGMYVPAIDRWIRDRKFDAWIPSADLLDTAAPLSDLERCFQLFAEFGTWNGGRFGHDLKPTAERADYPAELYQRFGVRMPARAQS